jgi:NhaP-type Na+/H+ or K+/H+ antiporter
MNGAIASLALGVTLANNRRSNFTLLKTIQVKGLTVVTNTERLVFAEMVFLLKTFFFLYLGISLTFSNSRLIFLVLLIMALLYAGRILITRLVISKKTSWEDASYVSLLIPKGLAAAILAGLPLAAGIAGGQSIQSLAFYMVLFSIVLTAIIVPLVTGFKPVNKFFKTIFRKYAEKDEIGSEPQPGVIPLIISELHEESDPYE